MRVLIRVTRLVNALLPISFLSMAIARRSAGDDGMGRSRVDTMKAAS